MAEKLTTIEFDDTDSELLPLLWNAMYGNVRIQTGQIRAHNAVLNKLESVLDAEFDKKPIEETLQAPGKTVLNIYRVNVEAPAGPVAMELNNGELNHIKFILKSMTWPMQLSRLAEKLLEKFDIDS